MFIRWGRLHPGLVCGLLFLAGSLAGGLLIRAEAGGPVHAALAPPDGAVPAPAPQGAFSSTPTPTAMVAGSTPTATPACLAPDPVQNGGFETGSLAPWIADGFANPPHVITTPTHTGSYAAQVGTVAGPEPLGNSSMYQPIMVPPGGGTLSFWYWLFCAGCDSDHPGIIVFDYQDAYITDADGHVLVQIMHMQGNSFAWEHFTYNLAAFAGRTVRLKFLVYQDGFGDDTGMFIDDVTVQAPGPCASVTPSPTPACFASDPVQNGGFETGSLAPWLVDVATPLPQVTTQHVHSGNYAALAGTASGPETDGVSSFYQPFTVPPSGGTLSFWYWPSGGLLNLQPDYQNAYITDANGQSVRETLLHTSEDTAAWQYYSTALAPFAGQTVALKFQVGQHVGNGQVTGLFVDDVAVQAAAPCLTATSTPATSATRTSTPTTTTSPTPNPQPPTPSATPCLIQFSDVPANDPFYPYIRCLACRNILSGYSSSPPCTTGQTPCFNGGATITRGQAAKIVSNAAGYADLIPSTQQTFTDVPPSNPFWVYVERAVRHNVISGYSTRPPCLGGTPCFLPGNPVTRGQLAKIDANAAGYAEAIPSTQQTFTDVPAGSPFWLYVERVYLHAVISGYSTRPPCPGGVPCFLPGNAVTRSQTAKIVANSFFPACQTPAR